MKKLITSLLCLACVSPLFAETYEYLTLTETDGTETSINVSDLNIVYSNGSLVATNSGGTQTFALSSLSKMYFAYTAAGSDSMAGVEAVAAYADTDAPVSVYTVDGVLQGRYANTATAMATLKAGAYIFKTANKSFKAIVR